MLNRRIVFMGKVPVTEIRVLRIFHSCRQIKFFIIPVRKALSHPVLIRFGKISSEHAVTVVTGIIKTCHTVAEFTNKILVGNIIQIIFIVPAALENIPAAHGSQPVTGPVRTDLPVRLVHGILSFTQNPRVVI